MYVCMSTIVQHDTYVHMHTYKKKIIGREISQTVFNEFRRCLITRYHQALRNAAVRRATALAVLVVSLRGTVVPGLTLHVARCSGCTGVGITTRASLVLSGVCT